MDNCLNFCVFRSMLVPGVNENKKYENYINLMKIYQSSSFH